MCRADPEETHAADIAFNVQVVIGSHIRGDTDGGGILMAGNGLSDSCQYKVRVLKRKGAFRIDRQQGGNLQVIAKGPQDFPLQGPGGRQV